MSALLLATSLDAAAVQSFDVTFWFIEAGSPPPPVPEPGTLLLLGIGLVGLGVGRMSRASGRSSA